MALQSVTPAIPTSADAIPSMDCHTASALYSIRGLAKMMADRDEGTDEIMSGIAAIQLLAEVELKRCGQL